MGVSGLPDYAARILSDSQQELTRSSDRAGLRPSDVVQQVAAKKVDNVSELRLTTVAALRPGTSVPFQVQRGRETLNLTVTSAQRPER